jgi:hypothetical protein
VRLLRFTTTLALLSCSFVLHTPVVAGFQVPKELAFWEVKLVFWEVAIITCNLYVVKIITLS